MPSRRALAGVVGVVATAAVAATPVAGLSPAGRYALATMVFAGVFWLTEALPLPVTALCVPLLLTALGVFPTVGGAVAGFADPVIFLLFAGFTLAAALQKYGIDRRVALGIVAAVGTSPKRLVLAVMVATALLSMLVSNTATAAMMAPVALGVAGQAVGRDVGHLARRDSTPGAVEGPRADAEVGDGATAAPPRDPADYSNLEIATLLGVAYAASIGGVGTVIGSPPNAIVVSAVERTLGVSIGFVGWMIVGVPLVVVCLPLAWYLLAVRIYPPAVEDVSAARDQAREARRAAGDLPDRGRRVVVVTAATALLWLLGGLEGLLAPRLPPRVATTLFGGPGPSLVGAGAHQGLLYFVVVGLLAVVALFATRTLEWEDVEGIDWGTLLLLGGGLSLANALAETDATAWLADVVLGALAGVPALVLVLGLVVVTVGLGELASNTAMAAILAPLLLEAGPRYAGTLGVGDEAAAVFLTVVVGAAASFGFALPVATPPNAIVFGTGRMDKDHMLRAGAVLDAVMAVVVTLVLLGVFRTVWWLVV